MLGGHGGASSGVQCGEDMLAILVMRPLRRDKTPAVSGSELSGGDDMVHSGDDGQWCLSNGEVSTR